MVCFWQVTYKRGVMQVCACVCEGERERESHKPWLHVALCSTCALLPPLRVLKSSLRRLSITASLEVCRWSKGRRCEVSTETTENGIVHHHPLPFPTLPLTLLLLLWPLLRFCCCRVQVQVSPVSGTTSTSSLPNRGMLASSR